MTAPTRNPLAIVALCASGSIAVLWVILPVLPVIGLVPGITGIVIGYVTVGLLVLGFITSIAFFAIVGFGGAFSY